MNETVTQIEQAMLSALEADTDLAEKVRNFDLLSTLDQDELRTLCSLGPMIGVIALRGKYDGDLTGVADETGEFAVVALDHNLRSGAAGKGGAVGEVGVWALLHRAAEVLHHHPERLGLDIHDIVVTSRSLLFASRTACGVSLAVEVTWRHQT